MVDEEEEQKEGNDSEGRDDELWVTVVTATVTKPGLRTSDTRKGKEVMVGGGSWLS